MLTVNNLSVRFGDLTIVNNASLHVKENEWLMLVGPNGAGKSTLVNAISQAVPYTGEVLIHGENVRGIKSTRLARLVGVLSQQHQVGYSFTVEEVVRLGRYSYSKGIFAASAAEDTESVEQALALTGMEPLKNHSVLTLSGGELQRTFLAQLIAQNPSILILDEPANHLDLIYQKQVFEMVREWAKKPGRAAVAVVHDLSLAKAFGTHAALMDHGSIVAMGEIKEALAPETLSKVYGIDVSAWMRRMLSQWS